MECESKEQIVMSEIRVSKFEVDWPEMWFKVTFFVDGQGSFKINIKI